MGRPRFHPIRSTLAAIAVAGAMFLTFAAPAAATPWQKSWGDYDNQQQWHNASWWLKNRHDWVTLNHPEWTENYAKTRGQIGDSDRFHGRHYGDGGTDRSVAAALRAATDERAKASIKAEVSVKKGRES
jgi:hypothetical protein